MTPAVFRVRYLASGVQILIGGAYRRVCAQKYQEGAFCVDFRIHRRVLRFTRRSGWRRGVRWRVASFPLQCDMLARIARNGCT